MVQILIFDVRLCRLALLREAATGGGAMASAKM